MPTSEQLTIIGLPQSGPIVIRGAAGSGKTTTALYRLKETVRFWQRRVRDGYVQGPVRVLVLTYNRTLRGYIDELARTDIAGIDVDLTIDTFSRWAWHATGSPKLAGPGAIASDLRSLGRSLPLTESFLRDEVGYLLGRFPPDELERYVGCERTGRGVTPRVASGMRRQILDEVVYPYGEWKKDCGLLDWNDVAVAMRSSATVNPYQVVVVDETQDFSANQMRAVVAHLAPQHSSTFILDGAQRIYPQKFQWSEVGLSVGLSNSRRLARNFRNTVEVAAFAAPLLDAVELTDDGSVPDLSACTTHGPKPLLVRGKFSGQVQKVIEYIQGLDPDSGESIAILHAKGWFDLVRSKLDGAGIAHVTLTRSTDWPAGPESVALSTMHSVKGLEFDHVIIVGLNQETMPHGAEDGDSERDAHLRLLAMAVGRARKSVLLTFKPSEATDLIDCFDPSTYEVVDA